MASLTNLLKTLLPKKKPPAGGLSYDNTWNPSATTSYLPVPAYREHLSDIFTDRASDTSITLLPILFRTDPDISAAVNAYLTLADTEPWWVVKDVNGVISRPGQAALEQLLLKLFTRFDYTTVNFDYRRSLSALCEQMRYMLLLRGGIGAELVVDKMAWPNTIRQIDLATVKWKEVSLGQFVPYQTPKAGGSEFAIDIPTFVVAFHRQDPTTMSPYSPFISAINTIASRQQIINDLYRLMQMTGYPRIKVTMLESVLRKNAPQVCQNDPAEMLKYITARRQEIQTLFTNLRVDQAVVTTDSVTVGLINETKAAMELDIAPIIAVYNAQNQAALKVMSTIIGRGESGVNTASVEARIFAMNADQINNPIAEILSQLFTLGIRLMGIDAIVTVGFAPAELRSSLELETNMLIRQNRLRQELSDGLITDDEYHLEIYNRIRPDGIPELSGTHFVKSTATAATTASGDPAGTQPDATTRVATPDAGNKPAKDNKTKGA